MNTAGGAPLGFTYNGTSYFYILNLQGDVIGIYDSNGNVVVEYTYDSWGKLISITGSLADTIGIKNPLRYRGYYYDTETSFYYLQSRYYDPETGRFISRDSYLIAGNDIIQGTNMYAYCYNKPVMYVDPTGHASLLALDLNRLYSFVYSLYYIMAAIGGEKLIAWSYFSKSLEEIGFEFKIEGIPTISVYTAESGVKCASVSFAARRTENAPIEQFSGIVYYGTGTEWLEQYKDEYNNEIKPSNIFGDVLGFIKVIGELISWYGLSFDLVSWFYKDPYKEGLSDVYDKAIKDQTETYYFISYIAKPNGNLYLYHRGVVG